MASNPNDVRIAQALLRLREIPKPTITEREDLRLWDINQVLTDIDRIYELSDYLYDIPRELLPNEALEAIARALEEAVSVIERLRDFDMKSSPDAKGVVTSQFNSIRQTSYRLAVAALPWVVYLRMKRDIPSEIELRLRGLAESAQKSASEIDSIVKTAQQAAASVGAAAYARDFKTIAEKFDAASRTWLWATGCAAGVTVGLAFVMWCWPESLSTPAFLVQKVGTKLFVLGILLSATLWCGRIYKASKNLSAINHHRALSIQTFEVFKKSTSDPATQNAVLIEATRAVFENLPTGYLGAGGESDMKVLEVVRSIIPGKSEQA